MTLPSVQAAPGFYGCPICKVVKPTSEFYPSSRDGRGHSSYCKECRRRTKRQSERAGRTSDPTAAARFASFVDLNGADGCHVWTGATRHGHGHFYYMGKMARAHRVSLELAGRPVPAHLHVDHICRNRACVNPEHLRAVTPRQNALENNMSPLAVNAARTECPNGHPYTPENTRHYTPKYSIDAHGRRCAGRPTRVCIACRRARCRKAYLKTRNPKCTDQEKT